jgi:hypothetical protein
MNPDSRIAMKEKQPAQAFEKWEKTKVVGR